MIFQTVEGFTFSKDNLTMTFRRHSVSKSERIYTPRPYFVILHGKDDVVFVVVCFYFEMSLLFKSG